MNVWGVFGHLSAVVPEHVRSPSGWVAALDPGSMQENFLTVFTMMQLDFLRGSTEIQN